MTTMNQLSEDYQRIEQSILYLEENVRHQPDLSEVAASVGLSEYHFQRLFTRWAGISPKRFLQFLTKESAKQLLDRTSILSTTYETGLSGPSRLHDLLVQCEAVTPGEYRSRGAGMVITYGFHPSLFGECLIALTGRGICFLAFVDGGRKSALERLRLDWENAVLKEDPTRTRSVVDQVFSPFSLSSGESKTFRSITLHVRGTNFQIKVWEALLRLPPGTAISYESLAEKIHSTRAARAVGNALARNPVAFIIPCHRVLQKTGRFGNYRYGSARKQAILGWEMAQQEE
jgi:AraC family transcriptional regulator of adaptative response/methylated-DNA-[protein]-cysteine methyltransferase